jgi:hypothetical protein
MSLRYRIIDQITDLYEVVDQDQHALIGDILAEFDAGIRLLDEGDTTLSGRIKSLMKRVRAVADQAGDPTKAIKDVFKQTLDTFAKRSKNLSQAQHVGRMVVARGSSDAMVLATATMMLANAFLASNPSEAMRVVNSLTTSLNHEKMGENASMGGVGAGGIAATPMLFSAPKKKKRKRVFPESALNLDMRFLPAACIAWLMDQPENQRDAAREIAVAAYEVGNPISVATLLRADTQVLVLRDQNGLAVFHVYPDGGVSCNGERCSGHEAVERALADIAPGETSADVEMTPAEPDAVQDSGMEELAQPITGIAFASATLASQNAPQQASQGDPSLSWGDLEHLDQQDRGGPLIP